MVPWRHIVGSVGIVGSQSSHAMYDTGYWCKSASHRLWDDADTYLGVDSFALTEGVRDEHDLYDVCVYASICSIYIYDTYDTRRGRAR